MKKLIQFTLAAALVLMAGVEVRAETPKMGYMDCLAYNIYFEAKGEGIDGMIAVGHVTKNRVESKLFPDT